MKLQAIESAAAELADKNGILFLTRRNVCEHAGVPVGSFTSITGRPFSEWVVSFAQANEFEIVSSVGARVAPALRRAQILSAGVMVARREGLNAVNRSSVAKKAKVSTSCVSHHFPIIELFLSAIIAQACDDLDGRVIGEAILGGHINDPTEDQLEAARVAMNAGCQ